MLSPLLRPLFLLSALTCSLYAQDAAALWAGKVQPLFDVQCVKCHGPIEQKSGLELDTPEAVLKGGDEGPAVVPGKPEESRLYQYLAADADPHMPPKKQLTDAERAVVHEWITALSAPPAAAEKPEPRVFPSVTTAIDTLLSESWQQRGITPAPPLSDAAWCRRIYLDLAGRIPTAAEVTSFLQQPAETRRAPLVDQLLASDAFAIHMRELWDVLLMGRGKRGNADDRRQHGWHTFLEHAFRTNRPWHDTVRALLSGRPDKPENTGASWFLYERRNEHQQIAEAVAPIVYGTRIDCAQCHDHPLAREIKQAHYWGLVAAYNRSKNVDGTALVAESATGGFINFTNLKKESQPAVITLLSGRSVAEDRPAGDSKEQDRDDLYVDPAAKARVPKFSRREAFALAATQDNPLLARAFVNRTWEILTGRGIVHPADEMNARNVPSHPALLDWLAQDFAASGYDVRRLIRGIALSKACALTAGDAPPDSFAATPERPLTAEQIARSWLIAAGLPPDDDTLRKATVAALPDVLPRDYNATFQQAQFLTNSPALSAILQPAEGNTAARLAALSDALSRARAAFTATLGREPDAAELQHATVFLNNRPADPAASIRDFLWALLTCAEFLTAPR
jgi:mono/diheme cytochrome c family protein